MINLGRDRVANLRRLHHLFRHTTEALPVRVSISTAVTGQVSDDLRALTVATQNVRADNVRIATNDRAVVILLEQGRVDERHPHVGLFELARDPATRSPLLFDPLGLSPREERTQFSAAQLTLGLVFERHSARSLVVRCWRHERASDLLLKTGLSLRQAFIARG